MKSTQCANSLSLNYWHLVRAEMSVFIIAVMYVPAEKGHIKNKMPDEDCVCARWRSRSGFPSVYCQPPAGSLGPNWGATFYSTYLKTEAVGSDLFFFGYVNKVSRALPLSLRYFIFMLRGERNTLCLPFSRFLTISTEIAEAAPTQSCCPASRPCTTAGEEPLNATFNRAPP